MLRILKHVLALSINWNRRGQLSTLDHQNARSAPTLTAGLEIKHLDTCASQSKGRRKRRRRRITRKDYFSNIPVELHYVILSYLYAEDLLVMSRVSHHLRNITLSRDSRPIWATCLCNSRLAPCPSDLSEPRYTSLLFESHCDACGSVDITVQTHYEMRVRFCLDCLYENVEKGRIIAENFDGKLAVSPEMFTLLPHLGDDGSMPFSHYLLDEQLFVKTDFIKVLQGYKNAKATDTHCLAAYVKDQRRKRMAIINHCIKLRYWTNEREIREKTRMMEERFRQYI